MVVRMMVVAWGECDHVDVCLNMIIDIINITTINIFSVLVSR